MCPDQCERILPHHLQRHNLHSNLLFLANHHGPLLTDTFTPPPRGRIRPLGFYLVNRHHQKDFREREAMNRVVRDLEHNRLLMHAMNDADCLPFDLSLSASRCDAATQSSVT